MTDYVINASGMPAMCYLCGKPATTFINTSVNLASSAPSHTEPVCKEHDPYRLDDMTMVSKTTRPAELAEVQRLQQENAMLRQVLAMTDPCIHQEVDNARQAHDDGRTITLEQYMADRGLQ